MDHELIAFLETEPTTLDRHPHRPTRRENTMSLITTSAMLLATSAAVFAVGLIPTPLAAQPALAGTAAEDAAIRPFRVDIPDEALADLRRRIAATKWPKRETVTDASQGVQLATM